jgi:hypothetical protein
MTAEKVHRGITHMVSNGVSYVDAICEYAISKNIDIEVVADLIKRSPVLKEKLRSEAVLMRTVKQSDTEIDITTLY